MSASLATSWTTRRPPPTTPRGRAIDPDPTRPLASAVPLPTRFDSLPGPRRLGLVAAVALATCESHGCRCRGAPAAAMSPEAAGVAWPELRSQLDRAGSLAEALAAAAGARAALARRLEAALEVRKESLRQGAALDEMRRRLELRRVRVEEVLVAKRIAIQGVERRKEQLQAQIDRVLRLSGSVAAANRQVQEENELLSGEKARLVDLQRRLRMRRQSMIGQVAALYPVNVFHDLPHAENLGGNTDGAHGTHSEENGALPEENGTHVLNITKFPQVHVLTFFGWQIRHTRKQKNYTEKELQRSAAVLGYAAHDTEQLLNYIGAESSGRRVFVLLLYLLFKFSTGFFAFLLSSSPVIICATLLLAVLISHGSTKLPEIDEERKALADTSAPKSADVSRNIHCEPQRKFSVPSLKEKTVSLKDGGIKEACFGRVRATEHFQMDDSVPLLKGAYQENERADTFDVLEETLTPTNSMVAVHQKVAREEFMEDNQERESKYTFPRDDKGDRCADLFKVVDQSRVDENQTTCSMHSSSENVRQDVEMMAKADHDRGSPDSQRDEVRVVSEDRPTGTCKWGRAFSVRRRKKLSDIKIEAINADVDNQLDSSLVGSPFGRIGISDGSLGSGSAQADCTSPATPAADIAPVLHEIDPLLSADFSHPDPIKNGSDNHFCMSPQDPKIDGDSNDEADKSKAEDNDEKNVVIDPTFGSCDDEKNVMDLGYSEMERNRRLEILMAKRRSRKNIIFDFDSDLIDVDNDHVCRRADEVVSLPVQVHTTSVPRRNPFDITSCSDETEIPSSAPSILDPRNHRFDYTSEQSDENDLHEHGNFGPHEFMEVSHRDMFFRKHESFSLGSQGKRLSRFKPCFVLDPMDIEELRASDFQMQFSCKSVSTLSAVTESDNISSVADQEDLSDFIKNDSSRKYESPGLPTMGSDITYVGGK
ncbi:hypothetical protein ABZP36_028405 [Zizania latifolia]